jgi:hypothetical protein
MQERRRAHRRSLEKCAGTLSDRGFLGRLIGLGRLYPFRAHDCSMEGMQLVSYAPIQRDRRYTFTFRDPREGGSFNIAGEVVWVEPVRDPNDGSRGWRGGVRFEELGIHQQVQLRTHLKLHGERDMTIRKTQVRRYYQRGSLD